MYRPDNTLQHLRLQQRQVSAASKRVCFQLVLRWLRTLSIDCSDVPRSKSYAFLQRTLASQEYFVLRCAVQRVVVKELRDDGSVTRLQQYVASLPRLTVLDLRGCCCINRDAGLRAMNSVPEKFLNHLYIAVAEAQPCLQQLYLPPSSSISQSTLDCFTQLEELDVTSCQNITNVNFCAATLRVLYANGCQKLTNDGFQRATKLEVLHVACCKEISSVLPFAHSLLELNASFSCGISSAALSQCYRLQVLDARNNPKIDSLRPFAGRLRELCAVDGSNSPQLGDSELSEANQLVKLKVSHNRRVTTVAPFGGTLIELNASGVCQIDNIGLATATNLVCLNASSNPRIQSLAPCASTLLELDVRGDCGLGDKALAHATNLFRLGSFLHPDSKKQERITTVAPFGKSLRHLVTIGDCCLSDAGLTAATNLVTLDCSHNARITNFAFCENSLQVLIASGTDCGLKRIDQIHNAPQLRYVWVPENKSIPPQTLKHRFCPVHNDESPFVRDVCPQPFQ